MHFPSSGAITSCRQCHHVESTLGPLMSMLSMPLTPGWIPAAASQDNTRHTNRVDSISLCAWYLTRTGVSWYMYYAGTMSYAVKLRCSLCSLHQLLYPLQTSLDRLEPTPQPDRAASWPRRGRHGPNIVFPGALTNPSVVFSHGPRQGGSSPQHCVTWPGDAITSMSSPFDSSISR